MPSIFRAIAPAELDPTHQRGYDYNMSRAAALRQAAFGSDAPREHLLSAANRAEQSAREIAWKQPVVAAYARGDQVQIGVIEEVRSNGVKVTSLTPIAIGLGENSHSLTAAGFAPTHKNPAIETEAFWDAVRQEQITSIQLPDGLLARAASNAVAFVAKALLGIKFQPGAIETVDMPNINVIDAASKANQQRINRPITAHLEKAAAANSHRVRVAIDEEISEITVRASNLDAMNERRESFEAATRDAAMAAATTIVRDGGTTTTTVNIEEVYSYQRIFMAETGF